jgi:hypothetical protein
MRPMRFIRPAAFLKFRPITAEETHITCKVHKICILLKEFTGMLSAAVM